jgi:hypothetical protein
LRRFGLGRKPCCPPPAPPASGRGGQQPHLLRSPKPQTKKGDGAVAGSAAPLVTLSRQSAWGTRRVRDKAGIS